METLDLIQHIIIELNSMHFLGTNLDEEANSKDSKVEYTKNLLFDKKVRKNIHFQFEEMSSEDLKTRRIKRYLSEISYNQLDSKYLLSESNLDYSWSESISDQRVRSKRNSKDVEDFRKSTQDWIEFTEKSVRLGAMIGIPIGVLAAVLYKHWHG